ncbi:MAG TPA: hypothetical protein VFF67_10170 [Thermoplasmata archaeon]|nr:hypothetical protein [Thermoplasmata archaeon]
MIGCSYCGREPAQPLYPGTFNWLACRDCGNRQHDALEEIARQVRVIPIPAERGATLDDFSGVP